MLPELSTFLYNYWYSFHAVMKDYLCLRFLFILLCLENIVLFLPLLGIDFFSFVSSCFPFQLTALLNIEIESTSLFFIA